MEAKHTPVPWNSEAEFSISGTMAEAIDKQGVPIYHNGFHIGTWLDNEWQGVCPNVSFIVEACNNYERVKAERDELLGLARQCLLIFTNWDAKSTVEIRRSLIAAINKVEKGA